MEDQDVRLQERHTELVKIIKAFESLEKSEEWTTLKELVYGRSRKSIERQLLLASTEKVVDVNKIYHLQGQLMWARQYIETDKYIEILKKELENINNKIK